MSYIETILKKKAQIAIEKVSNGEKVDLETALGVVSGSETAKNQAYDILFEEYCELASSGRLNVQPVIAMQGLEDSIRDTKRFCELVSKAEKMIGFKKQRYILFRRSQECMFNEKDYDLQARPTCSNKESEYYSFSRKYNYRLNSHNRSKIIDDSYMETKQTLDFNEVLTLLRLLKGSAYKFTPVDISSEYKSYRIERGGLCHDPLANYTQGMMHNISINKGHIQKVSFAYTTDTKQRKILEQSLIKIQDRFYNFNELKDLNNLEYLTLNDIVLDDTSFLKKLTNLKGLDLSNTNIKDVSFLENFKKLREAHFSYNPITDISVLNEIPGLYRLDLNYTDIYKGPNANQNFKTLLNRRPNILGIKGTGINKDKFCRAMIDSGIVFHVEIED